MYSHPSESDGDWRLRIELREKLHVDRLSALLARGQGHLERIVRDGRIGEGAVVGAQDMTVIVYGSDESEPQEAEAAIRKALVADGLTCEIVAHPGVLRTGLDLIVTGPTHAVRDFVAYAKR